MRRIAVLFALLFAPAQLHAADFDPKPIDEVVEKAMKEFGVPGASVVIVRDGEVIYLKGFGVREKGKDEKVTPDTVFPIASCTKAFTATALAMLDEEGKLKWDDKVREHLDYFRLSDELADREVTLRDLLCHRTGMPRHDMLGRAEQRQHRSHQAVGEGEAVHVVPVEVGVLQCAVHHGRSDCRQDREK
jgi:CubicO group peptidase (beta-lactamase class C family)